MMFLSLPPPDQLFTILKIIAPDIGCTCDVHRFVCSNMMLLSRPVNGFGVLLYQPDMAPEVLAGCFVLHDGS